MSADRKNVIGQFQVQCRVIKALMIREVIAHFGREGLGALWLVAEPLSFTLPVMLLWHLVRSPFEHGVPMIELIWSGYMPLLLFRHVVGRTLSFIRHNAGLLYHRNVTILDVFVARTLVEIAENIGSAIVMFFVFYIPGIMSAPANLPLLLLGYIYAVWWSVSVGLIVGALSERTEWVEKIWQPFSYTYMFWGGFAYLADWLPLKLRAVALLQPSVQSYEIIRAGLLGNRIVPHYSLVYVTAVLAGLTLIGLAALRAGRRHVSLA